MIALVVIDTETGGLDPNRSCIIEMAAQVVVVDFGGFSIRGGPFHSRVRPDRAVEEQAASVNGYDEQQWSSEPDGADVFSRFRQWIMDRAKEHGELVWTGCNPVFDIKFFTSDRKRYGVEEPHGFSYRVCDVQSMALPLIFTGELRSVALRSLRAWAGIEGGQKHTALEDVNDTCVVLRKLFDRVVGMVAA